MIGMKKYGILVAEVCTPFIMGTAELLSNHTKSCPNMKSIRMLTMKFILDNAE